MMSLCTQQNGPPKDVHALIPRTSEYVTLHGKRDFVDVIKSMGPTIEKVAWIIQVDPI